MISEFDRLFFLAPKNFYFDNYEFTTSTFMPKIINVIFNDPATVVFWEDGTKTVVKCQKKTGDVFSKETGLAMAIAKKAYGNTGNFNDVFAKWVKRIDE